ncbi:MAG: hypothetical protein J1E80_05290 [Desulfovibrionaceae bacterium]|nr:hypothetical protein [Desulfovibrionaceae bacterium]
MRIRPASPAALALAVLVWLMPCLGGCGLTDTQAWKSSRRFYYTYVNTPARIDVSDPVTLSENDSRLASRLMAVDEQLSGLEQALDALGSVPDGAAVDALLRRFPWLSGLTLVDASGVILAAEPPVSLKQLDFTPLLECPPGSSPRALRAVVQDTVLGPEVLVARPLLAGGELQALLVASFDFRSLLPYTSTPGDLVVRTADILMWAGDEAGSLDGVDWSAQIAKRSHGVVRTESSAFVWLVRYMGGQPLVFATPVA